MVPRTMSRTIAIQEISTWQTKQNKTNKQPSFIDKDKHAPCALWWWVKLYDGWVARPNPITPNWIALNFTHLHKGQFGKPIRYGVFIWYHMLRNVVHLVFTLTYEFICFWGRTSLNISYFNCCWFQIANNGPGGVESFCNDH